MIRQFAEKLIRKRVSDGLFDVSLHAIQRMSERQIEIEKVLESIIYGKSIDFQRDKSTDNIKVLFQDSTDGVPEIYTVVAALDRPVIVTVCRTRDEVWECIENVLKRRERYLNE